MNEHPKGDRWVFINGVCYDVTSFAKEHPGGAHIFEVYHDADVTQYFQAIHINVEAAKNVLWRLPMLKRAPKPPSARDARLSAARQVTKQWTPPVAWICAVLGRPLLFFIAAMQFRGWIGGIFLGLAQQQALLVAHELLHGCLFPKKRALSFWLAWTYGGVLGGVGPCWWHKDHMRHHALCNVIDQDPSAGADPFIFIDAKQYASKQRGVVHRLLVALQPWTYPFLCLGAGRPNLHVISLVQSPQKITDAVALGLYFFFLRHFSMKTIISAYLVCSYIHVQLNAAHYATGMVRKVPHDFWEHQTSTTENYIVPRYLEWLHGGLHRQVEHHLFPSVATPLLKKAGELVDAPKAVESFETLSAKCWNTVSRVSIEALR